MSLRLEMLQVARLAPKTLGESAALVLRFLKSRQHPAGGFVNRAGDADLYYTVFGLESLLALQADLPTDSVVPYLQSFHDVDKLDFVHTACLARAYACLPAPLRASAPKEALRNRLEAFRTADGAYSATPNAQAGTLYGCFLALGAYQDLNLPLPDPFVPSCLRASVPSSPFIARIASLRAEDGGYANDEGIPFGLTPPTAAAATLLRHLGAPIPPDIKDWLLARHLASGGFFATPMAPAPDLLSTATALHALCGLNADLDPIKDPCLDFLDSLWTNQGSFYATWEDDALDCEYTYYALLALGHLSV